MLTRMGTRERKILPCFISTQSGKQDSQHKSGCVRLSDQRTSKAHTRTRRNKMQQLTSMRRTGQTWHAELTPWDCSWGSQKLACRYCKKIYFQSVNAAIEGYRGNIRHAINARQSMPVSRAQTPSKGMKTWRQWGQENESLTGMWDSVDTENSICPVYCDCVRCEVQTRCRARHAISWPKATSKPFCKSIQAKHWENLTMPLTQVPVKYTTFDILY